MPGNRMKLLDSTVVRITRHHHCRYDTTVHRAELWWDRQLWQAHNSIPCDERQEYREAAAIQQETKCNRTQAPVECPRIWICDAEAGALERPVSRFVPSRAWLWVHGAHASVYAAIITCHSIVSDIGIGFFDISDALFPQQFCTKFDIIKSIWVNCILADEACERQRHQVVYTTSLTTRNVDFHSTLAISASYIDFFQRKPAISSKTLHHISQAYALVNIKLSGPLSVSDSAIAAVVSLAIYQQVHHQPATGLVHLHGLYRMIQLRGGITSLMQENRVLALKPLRYVNSF